MRQWSQRELIPRASKDKLELFAKLEGTPLTPKPQHVNFGDYVEHWYETAWERLDSHTTKTDYRCSIDSQILPYFKDMTFYEINRGVMRTFARQLCHLKGERKGSRCQGSGLPTYSSLCGQSGTMSVTNTSGNLPIRRLKSQVDMAAGKD